MIFTIILGLGVLGIAFVHYLQGLFSATISAILAIICAVFALSFHETLIESVLGGSAANIAHGMMLLLLFMGSYSILRAVFDKCIPGQIRVPFLVDRIGGALMGLVAGSFVAGIVAIAAQELPFGPTFMGYSRYETESDRTVPVPQPNHQMSKTVGIFDEIKSNSPGVFDDGTKHTLYFDDLVINTVAYLSNGGALAGSHSLTSIHPDLLQELMGQRLGIELGAKRVALNLPAKRLEDVKVVGLFSLPSIPEADAEIAKFRPAFANQIGKTLKPMPDSILLVVRTAFTRTAGDTDGLVRVSPGAVRLVTPTDADATHFANYYPLGTLQGARTLYLNKLDDPIFVNVSEGEAQAADFVFMVKKDGFVDGKKKVQPGAFLEVKRLGRVDLADQVVKSEFVTSPIVKVIRKTLVLDVPPTPVVAVVTPAPTPTPTPTPTPPPSLHSPQEIAKPAGNGILEISGAASSSALPIPIACGDDSSKLSIVLPGGAGMLKNGRFLSLTLDVQETQDKLSAGARPVKDLLAKDGEGLIIVSATAVDGKWEWAEKADQLSIVDSAGKKYPANGLWADVDQDGKKFFARYSTNYPVDAVTAGTAGKAGNVWLCFSVPAGTEVKQVVLDTVVLGEFPPVKAEGQ